MNVILKLDSAVELPESSMFLTCAAQPNFHCSFTVYKDTTPNADLIYAGTANRWPVLSLVAKLDALVFYRYTGRVWLETDIFTGYPCHVRCEYSESVLCLFVNGRKQISHTIILPPIGCWALGITPLMHGTLSPGPAIVSDITILDEPFTAGPAALSQNEPLNYPALALLSHEARKMPKPALLLVDLDDTLGLNQRNNWRNATPLINHLYDFIKTLMADNGWCARSHFKGELNDELLVLLSAETAERAAAEIIQKIRNTSHLGLAAGAVTVSIGIGAGTSKFSHLYIRAQMAMRNAKLTGRDTFRTVCQFH